MSVFERKLQQWRQLWPWERRVLLLLLWRLPLIAVLLRLVNIGKLLALASSSQCNARASGLPAGMGAAAFARRCEQLVSIAARNGLYQASCLPRALALQQLLKSFGVPAELRIGVLPGSLPLQAHAWVECAQESLGGEVEQYQLIALNRANLSMQPPMVFDDNGGRK